MIFLNSQNNLQQCYYVKKGLIVFFLNKQNQPITFHPKFSTQTTRLTQKQTIMCFCRFYGQKTQTIDTKKESLALSRNSIKRVQRSSFFKIVAREKKEQKNKLFRRCKWRKSVKKRKWWDRRPPLPKKKLPLALEKWAKVLKICKKIYWKPKKTGVSRLNIKRSRVASNLTGGIIRSLKKLKRKQRTGSFNKTFFFYTVLAYRNKYAQLNQFKGLRSFLTTQKKYLPIRLQKKHKVKINFFYIQYYKFKITYSEQVAKARRVQTPVFSQNIRKFYRKNKNRLQRLVRKHYLAKFKLVQKSQIARITKRFNKLYRTIVSAKQALLFFKIKQFLIKFFFKKRIQLLLKKHQYYFTQKIQARLKKKIRLILKKKNPTRLKKKTRTSRHGWNPPILKLFQKYKVYWKKIKILQIRASVSRPIRRRVETRVTKNQVHVAKQVTSPRQPTNRKVLAVRRFQMKLKIKKIFNFFAKWYACSVTAQTGVLTKFFFPKKSIQRFVKAFLKKYVMSKKKFFHPVQRFAFLKKNSLRLYAHYYLKRTKAKRRRKIHKLQQLMQRKRRKWGVRRQRRTQRVWKKLLRKRIRKHIKRKPRRKQKWKQRSGHRQKILGRKYNSLLLVKKLNNLHLNYLLKQKLAKHINTSKLAPTFLKKFSHFFKNYLNVSTVQFFFKLKFFTMLNKQFRKNKISFYKLATWLYKINSLKILLQTNTGAGLTLKLLASKRFNRKVFTKSLKQRYFTRRFFTNHELLPIVLNCFFKRTSTYYLLAFIGLMLKKFKKHYQILTHINRFLIYFFKLTSSHAPITGLKYVIRGRVNGAPRKKNKIFSFGKVRSHTYKTTFDYTQLSRETRYGTFGLKMWRYF